MDDEAIGAWVADIDTDDLLRLADLVHTELVGRLRAARAALDRD